MRWGLRVSVCMCVCVKAHQCWGNINQVWYSVSLVNDPVMGIDYWDVEESLRKSFSFLNKNSKSKYLFSNFAHCYVRMWCLGLQQSPLIIKRKLQQLTGWRWQNLKVRANWKHPTARSALNGIMIFSFIFIILCWFFATHAENILTRNLVRTKSVKNCRPCARWSRALPSNNRHHHHHRIMDFLSPAQSSASLTPWSQ